MLKMAKFDACLRFHQVLLCVVTLASGLAACIGSGWVSRILAGKCVLYSDIKFAVGPNHTVNMVTEESTWGPEWRCEYCTFISATAAIYAVIWFWFYVLLSETRYSVVENRLRLSSVLYFRQENDEAPPDFKIVIPSLVLNIVLFVCVCFSVAFHDGGIDSWCQNLATSTSGAYTCEYPGHVVWTNPSGGAYVYLYLKVTLVGNWILFASLALNIVLLSCRIYNHSLNGKNTSCRENEAGNRNAIREEITIDDRASNTSHEDNTDKALLVTV